MFNELIDERRNQILNQKINYDYSTFHYKGKRYLKKVLMILIMHLFFYKNERW